jgi:hypothetical protein
MEHLRNTQDGCKCDREDGKNQLRALSELLMVLQHHAYFGRRASLHFRVETLAPLASMGKLRHETAMRID